MSKRWFLLGLLVIAGGIFFVARRGTHRAPAESSHPPIPAPTQAEKANPPSPAPKAEAPSDDINAGAPEALRQEIPKILGQLPSEFRSRVRLRLSPLMEGSPMWIARMELDGVRIEQNDIQLSFENGKVRRHTPVVFPFLAHEVGPFPEKDAGSLSERIQEILSSESAEVVNSVEALENSWWPNRATALTACLNYKVVYTDARNGQRDETWCLNANSGRVEFRRSNRRF